MKEYKKRNGHLQSLLGKVETDQAKELDETMDIHHNGESKFQKYQLLRLPPPLELQRSTRCALHSTRRRGCEDPLGSHIENDNNFESKKNQ
ncbi:hypothetical protein TNCV_2853281 [Trichonephila clavipes]|uniref:Uncharacterized protein n=1 Tax=Trichonephila clavipes TaxID=2585209 RepID=A0A8X6UZ86_TRICX|nr:hypothetical protein TNCV_2853281 [Trichonephila clavipes]